jgi:hypothetical protein
MYRIATNEPLYKSKAKKGGITSEVLQKTKQLII